jgi:FeS assembly protein IscX
MGNPLYWDSTYAIVLALMKQHPALDPETVSTSQLLDLIVALPDFADEAILANEDLLVEILRFWYEEATFHE